MGTCSRIPIQRLDIRLTSDDRRVITRPFLLPLHRIHTLFAQLGAVPEPAVKKMLSRVHGDYRGRHKNIQTIFARNFESVAAQAGNCHGWSPQRRQLAGSYLTMEYAVESAALFNPSIVAHPDQSDVPAGSIRFILSLRATGEGHISSIVFRTGLIGPDRTFTLDPPARYLNRSRMIPDKLYDKALFSRKLADLGVDHPIVEKICALVDDRFTLPHLQEAIHRVESRLKDDDDREAAEGAMQSVFWLARSNYHIELARTADLSELVIFPMSEDESHGIEDLRMVRFVDDKKKVTYYGTYTAYNGTNTVPMLLWTKTFKRIEIHSLNGACAQNKGFALFPRTIDGQYVMCSRIDGENLFIMVSQHPHFWETAEKIHLPREPWEWVQLGNCGSPIETPEGWLLLTHGVGPMRSYCVGAVLLDLNDPLRVIGHLPEPLLCPEGDEREGYVPNVVYSCGAMVHRDDIYIPYALADKSTAVAVASLDRLLNCLLENPPAARR